MDKNIIGVNAGRVWRVMNEVEKEISLFELAEKLGLSVESTALAVGWLASENKICIHSRDGLIRISNEHHSFSFG